MRDTVLVTWHFSLHWVLGKLSLVLLHILFAYHRHPCLMMSHSTLHLRPSNGADADADEAASLGDLDELPTSPAADGHVSPHEVLRQQQTLTRQISSLQRRANQDSMQALRETTPLPPETLMQVMDFAGFWLDTRVSSSRVVGVSHRSEVLVRTAPMPAARLRRLRRLMFEFTSKDQGWSSYPETQGTFDGSWTWFEAHVQYPAETGQRVVFQLQRNRHAGERYEDYDLRFGPDDGIVRAALAGGEGTYVELVALASYPGWVNNVRRAAVTLSFADTFADGDGDGERDTSDAEGDAICRVQEV